MKVGGRGWEACEFLAVIDRAQPDLVGALWRAIAERLTMQNGMLIFSNFLYQRSSDVVSRISLFGI
jgi:hypothetical protein